MCNETMSIIITTNLTFNRWKYLMIHHYCRYGW